MQEEQRELPPRHRIHPAIDVGFPLSRRGVVENDSALRRDGEEAEDAARPDEYRGGSGEFRVRIERHGEDGEQSSREEELRPGVAENRVPRERNSQRNIELWNVHCAQIGIIEQLHRNSDEHGIIGGICIVFEGSSDIDEPLLEATQVEGRTLDVRYSEIVLKQFVRSSPHARNFHGLEGAPESLLSFGQCPDTATARES